MQYIVSKLLMHGRFREQLVTETDCLDDKNYCLYDYEMFSNTCGHGLMHSLMSSKVVVNEGFRFGSHSVQVDQQ